MFIRPEIVRRLDEAFQCGFEERLCEYLRKKIPSRTADLTELQLHEVVRSHMSAAGEFGMRSQSSIAQFVCLSLLPGPPFYHNRYLVAFLRYPGFDPDAKMRCIADQLSEQIAHLTTGNKP